MDSIDSKFNYLNEFNRLNDFESIMDIIVSNMITLSSESLIIQYYEYLSKYIKSLKIIQCNDYMVHHMILSKIYKISISIKQEYYLIFFELYISKLNDDMLIRICIDIHNIIYPNMYKKYIDHIFHNIKEHCFNFFDIFNIDYNNINNYFLELCFNEYSNNYNYETNEYNGKCNFIIKLINNNKKILVLHFILNNNIDSLLRLNIDNGSLTEGLPLKLNVFQLREFDLKLCNIKHRLFIVNKIYSYINMSCVHDSKLLDIIEKYNLKNYRIESVDFRSIIFDLDRDKQEYVKYLCDKYFTYFKYETIHYLITLYPNMILFHIKNSYKIIQSDTDYILTSIISSGLLNIFNKDDEELKKEYYYNFMDIVERFYIENNVKPQLKQSNNILYEELLFTFLNYNKNKYSKLFLIYIINTFDKNSISDSIFNSTDFEEYHNFYLNKNSSDHIKRAIKY